MRNKTTLLIIIILFLFPAILVAQEKTVTLSVNPDRVVGQIDERIYGQFLEHIYHSVNGGLWGEAVWNRSFEENCSREWNKRFDEIPNNESWIAKNGCLESPVISEIDPRFTIGDGAYRDYDFTVEGCKTSGENGFTVGVRSGSFRRGYLVVLGAGGNQKHEIQRYTFDKSAFKQVIEVLQSVPGKVETGQWYKVRVRCEGNNIKVWLDGQPLFEVNDKVGQQFGQACVATSQTQARFRNFSISGLKGEKLVEGNPAPARHWQTVENGVIAQDSINPLNDGFSLKVSSESGQTGIRQNKFYFRKNDLFSGSLWVRGDAPEGITIQVLDGEKIVSQTLLPAPTSEWKEYPVELSAEKELKNGSVQILVSGKATVWLDQFSLIPHSAKVIGGYRPDLYQAIADIKPALIRWPGGSFINGYNWQNGIGKQASRIGKKGWDELDPLSFGIDEFIDLCRKLNTEPLIPLTVNAKKPELVEGIMGMMEYCNGPATSKWGKIRAANGHPEPYQIKHWEIGNEEWNITPAEYAQVVRTYVPLMKKIDPSITISICGSGKLFAEGIGQAWNREVINECAELADFISIHHYENPSNYASGPAAFQKFLSETGEIIRQSKNPKLKIFVSEWNAQTTDWRGGLYCGGLLNEFEKNSDLIHMATPALWLRHVSAPQWDNAFINFNHCGWFAGGNYLVMKLWRKYYAPNRLETTGSADSLNVVATKSADGQRLILKVVNPSGKSRPLMINIEKGFKAGSAQMEIIAPGQLMSTNSLDQTDRIKPAVSKVKVVKNKISVIMPAVSAGVIELKHNK